MRFAFHTHTQQNGSLCALPKERSPALAPGPLNKIVKYKKPTRIAIGRVGVGPALPVPMLCLCAHLASALVPPGDSPFRRSNDLLSLGNDKARGVRTLLTHLDVDVSRVVAVGDGENDLGMLRLVGRGVAMGNAGAKVKAAARETLAATNDEDGVAEAIQRFVL